jgi:hypothetical protein
VLSLFLLLAPPVFLLTVPGWRWRHTSLSCKAALYTICFVCCRSCPFPDILPLHKSWPLSIPSCTCNLHVVQHAPECSLTKPQIALHRQCWSQSTPLQLCSYGCVHTVVALVLEPRSKFKLLLFTVLLVQLLPCRNIHRSYVKPLQTIDPGA